MTPLVYYPLAKATRTVPVEVALVVHGVTSKLEVTNRNLHNGITRLAFALAHRDGTVSEEVVLKLSAGLTMEEVDDLVKELKQFNARKSSYIATVEDNKT